MLARRGGVGATLGLLARYALRVTGLTNERRSPLLQVRKRGPVPSQSSPQAAPTPRCHHVACVSIFLLQYVKVRSVVITPGEGASARQQTLNVDGEAMIGPGPFRIHVLPSFLSAFGEF